MQLKSLVLVFCLLCLSACGGGSSETSTPQPPAPVANKAPVISVANLAVFESQHVSVNADVSDSDGTVQRYTWTQISGSEVTIDQPDSAQLAFIAPTVAQTETLQFELEVADDDGATSTAVVSITVKFNSPPTISVADISAAEQSTASIEALASDNDGGVASYTWEQLSGPDVLSMIPQGSSLTVTLPEVEEDTTATFRVRVTDAYGKSSQQDFNVVIQAFSYAFSVAGTVQTRQPNNGIITLMIGNQTFQTEADEQGKYAIDIALSEQHQDTVVRAHFQNAAESLPIALQAIMGTVEFVATKSASASSEPGLYLDINHLTTAFAMQLEEYDQSSEITDVVKLREAFEHADLSEANTLATAIVLINDYADNYPDLQLSETALADSTLQPSKYLVSVYYENARDNEYTLTNEVSHSLFEGISIPNITELPEVVYFHRNRGTHATGQIVFTDNGEASLVGNVRTIKLAWTEEDNGIVFGLHQDYREQIQQQCIEVYTDSSCANYLEDFSLNAINLAQDMTINVITLLQRNRSSSIEEKDWDEISNRYLIVQSKEQEQLVNPEDVIEMGASYLISTPSIDVSVDGGLIYTTASLSTVQLTFAGTLELGGLVTLRYPETDAYGAMGYRYTTGDWQLTPHNTIAIAMHDSSLFSELEIAIINADQTDINVSAMSKTGDQVRSSSYLMMKQQSAPDFSQVTGVYAYSGLSTDPLALFWFEVNEDGTALTVSVEDRNHNGTLSDEEFQLMPGYWRVNERGNLTIRRYKDSSGSYCVASGYFVEDTETCQLYHEREWQIVDTEDTAQPSKRVYLHQTHRFFGDPNLYGGDGSHEGPNQLIALSDFLTIMSKTTQRPMPIPEG